MKYYTREDWYDALKAVALSHCRPGAVRDFLGWTENWENETPEEAYYAEFPEDREGIQ